MKTALFFLALAVASPAWTADPTTFAQALAGQSIPFTRKLSDLNSDWRRFTTSASADAPATSATYLALLGAAGAGRNAYFTKGDTLNIEGEIFLIAYRLESKPVDIQALIRGGGPRGGQMPEPEKPTPDSPLALALLSIRSLGALNDIRPFELESELAGGDTSDAAREEAREKAARAANLNHLRQIGLALKLYVTDGDKTLPPMQSTETAAKALQPYAQGQNLFANVLPNPALAAKKPADIANPGQTIAFYEAAAANGTRGILYLDGRVERVTEAKWNELKKTARLP